ncbi:hypothetical protein OF83DRAFT_1178937 [Amylostereum chailletii]|nr:hypothetical protein OF83DRAFT_1178937 [Amylostereum chailletii]
MTAFFFRHGKVYLPAEIIKFGRRWTGQDMFNKLMPDQVAAVLDELSPPPEGAIALAFGRLETVDQALLEEEAKRWNEEGPPKEVVQKNASKKMESAMLWMSKWVARECGSYILALIIEPNSNGKLVSYKYDLSKDIGLTKKKFTDTVSVTALGSSHLDFPVENKQVAQQSKESPLAIETREGKLYFPTRESRLAWKTLKLEEKKNYMRQLWKVAMGLVSLEAVITPGWADLAENIHMHFPLDKMVAEELSAAFRELLLLEGGVFYCLGYHKAGFRPAEPMNKRAWVCNPTEVEVAKVALQQEKRNEINTAQQAKYAAIQVATQGAKAGTGDGIPGSLVPTSGNRHWPEKSPSEMGPHFLKHLKALLGMPESDYNDMVQEVLGTPLWATWLLSWPWMPAKITNSSV